jgi:hypothetical protein
MRFAPRLGMQKVFRVLLGACLCACLFASSVEAATVTIAWDPNNEPDLARYLVGYRTSPSGSETTVSVGLVTSWSLTTALEGRTYYFRVYAENAAGLRSAPSSEVATIVPLAPPPTGGGLALDRGRLSYGVVKSGSTVTQATPAQRMMVTQTASSSVAWSATTSNSWLRVSPTSGTGTAPITVTVAAGALNPGTYDGTVTIRPAGTTTNLNVPVRTRVHAAGSTIAPGGYFDTPTDGITNVAGAIAVTGWAVDDVAVSRVDIYRDPVSGEPNTQIYVGAASFIAGSRPDIEPHFAEYPLNYRAGWGFLVLTNMLPDLVNRRPAGGNGSFRLHAYAVDVEGHSTYLGAKRFTANNSGSSRPFGSIDTPAQGGTASGSAYAVFGWALSPRGSIPTNGSTISVFIDGTNVGHPVYNNNRSDISTLFPGYANSNGAVGYYMLNTTRLANGLHTISWVVTDNLGNTEGIGSRYFTVQNGTSAVTAAAVESSTLAEGTHGTAMGQSVDTVYEVPPDYSLVEVSKAASDDATPQTVFPEWTGAIEVKAQETEPIELRLANQFDEAGGTYEGYVVASREMRPLPIGSSLNTHTGVFKWQPGPGFVGSYELVFLRTLKTGVKTRIPVTITISPKADGDRP